MSVSFHVVITSNFPLICLSLPTNIKWPDPSINRGTYVCQRKVQVVRIGVMYQKGEGVQQSYKEASKWYRLAAEQGDDLAQGNLEIMHGNSLN